MPNTINNFWKYFSLTFSIGWAITSLIVGYMLSFPEIQYQIEKNEEKKQTEFIPAVNFLKSYIKENKRLPKPSNFIDFKTPDGEETHIKLYVNLDSLYIYNDRFEKPLKSYNSTDFVLSQWQGEWDAYYTSWDNSYSFDYLKNNLFRVRLESIVLYMSIGLIPLLLVIFRLRRREE